MLFEVLLAVCVLGVGLLTFLYAAPDLVVPLIYSLCEKVLLPFMVNQDIKSRERLIGDVGSPDAMRVIIAGAGYPGASRRLANQCVAIVANGDLVLFDIGAGSVANLLTYQLPLGKVKGVFLSNFKADRIGDLGELMVNSWFWGRRKRLNVYGGPGVDSVVAGVNMTYSQFVTYQSKHHGEMHMPSDCAPLKSISVLPDKEFKFPGGLCIKSIRVDHGNCEPAYGYKICFQDRCVIIAGDTVLPCAPLEKMAQDVDLLVVGGMMKSAIVMPFVEALKQTVGPRCAALCSDTMKNQADVLEVHQFAEKVRAKHVALTHTIPNSDLWIMRQILKMGAIQPTTVVKDDQEFVLPVGGNQIIMQKALPMNGLIAD